MGFIRSGFTGGFLGIVISIANLFVESKILEKLSSVGLYVAASFGKACIGTCTLVEKFTTLIATIVGNTIAYFVIFALISLAISVIKMWFTSSKQIQQQPVQQAPQTPVVVQQPVQPQQQSKSKEKEESEEESEEEQDGEDEKEEKPEVKNQGQQTQQSMQEESKEEKKPQKKELKKSKDKNKKRPKKKAKVRKK